MWTRMSRECDPDADADERTIVILISKFTIADGF